MENIQIENGSNDHQYFTIIPNFILNHSTAVAQALYLQLKRLAGEGGVAYPGSRYLMGKLGISYNTLKKEFDYLLEKGWIEYCGEREVKTEGGKQKVRAYKVIDLWQLNNDHYRSRGIKIETPQTAKGYQNRNARGIKIGAKEDPCIKKNNNYVAPDATPVLPEFVFEDYLQKMHADPRRHVQIIADYWIKKGYHLENKEQCESTIKRDARAAAALKAYSDARIAEVMDWLVLNADYIWTLETVGKKINENLKEAKVIGKKKKEFYQGMEVRRRRQDGKIFVLKDGEWFDFAGKEEEIKVIEVK